jgi:MFS family permease
MEAAASPPMSPPSSAPPSGLIEAKPAAPRARRRAADRRRGLSPAERRLGLRISTLEGTFASAFTALCGNGVGGNVFSYGFALVLGASNLWLGLLTALPQVACTGQAVGAYLLQRVRSRRRFVVWSCVVARNLCFALPLLAFALRRERALFAFVALYGLAAFVYQFATNGWTSWMSDTVPSALRGRYFSWRTNVCNLVGLVVGIPAAVALDAYAGGNVGASAEADARRLVGFVAVFAASAALGGVSTWLLTRQPEPRRAGEWEGVERRSEGPTPLRAFVAVPFRDAEFRRILAFFALFFFANGIGNPFWVPFILEDLGQKMSLVTVLTCAGGLAGLVTLPLWGRALDRFGAKPLLAIVAVVSSLHPFYYVVARPDFVLPIWADYLSSGIVWGGWNLAILDLQLTVVPEARGREMYFAAFAAATGLALAAGSVLSGLLADRIPGGRATVFVAVSVLRLASLALLARLREPGARPLGEVLVLARRRLFGV